MGALGRRALGRRVQSLGFREGFRFGASGSRAWSFGVGRLRFRALGCIGLRVSSFGLRVCHEEHWSFLVSESEAIARLGARKRLA